MRDLAKPDQRAARRMLSFLHDRVGTLADPRRVGQALKGCEPGKFRKCRVGKGRVNALIEDEALRIMVVRVGHRNDVYRPVQCMVSPSVRSTYTAPSQFGVRGQRPARVSIGTYTNVYPACFARFARPLGRSWGCASLSDCTGLRLR